MRQMFVMLWLLSSVILCAAQSDSKKTESKIIPDLNGTWILDKSKSYADPKLKLESTDITLVIIQREPEIKMIRKITQNGQESVEEAEYITTKSLNDSVSGQNTKLITKWNGRKLVTRKLTETTIMKIDGRPVKMEFMEEWEVSKDSKTLTQRIYVTHALSPPAPPTSKFVFTRVP